MIRIVCSQQSRGPVGVPDILRRHPERQSEITAVPSPIRGRRISDVGAVLGDSQLAVQRIHDLPGQLFPRGTGNAGTEDIHLDVGSGLFVAAREINRHVVLERAHQPAFGLAGDRGDGFAIGGLECLALLFGGGDGYMGVDHWHRVPPEACRPGNRVGLSVSSLVAFVITELWMVLPVCLVHCAFPDECR